MVAVADFWTTAWHKGYGPLKELSQGSKPQLVTTALICPTRTFQPSGDEQSPSAATATAPPDPGILYSSCALMESSPWVLREEFDENNQHCFACGEAALLSLFIAENNTSILSPLLPFNDSELDWRLGLQEAYNLCLRNP